MADKKYKIVFIGAGNVATHLGLALLKSKHTIVQVCSLRNSSSKELAKLLKSKISTSVEDIDTSADIYIVATNDDTITKVANKIKINNKIIVHTSGSIDMNVLQKASPNIGVFYPLQTFSKQKKIDFSKIPVCIEASNNKTSKVLKTLAKSISNNVIEIDSKQRKTIHLAAVFANNFTNHLYTIAEDILIKNDLPFDILKPLIEETNNKIRNNSPAKMQTGPSVRGDSKTLKAHEQLLLNDKDYLQVYKLLSKSIIKSKKNN